MYYVYEFFVVETGEIIYVGKGTGLRYKMRSQRSKMMKELLKRFECDSRIVKEFDNEEEAFAFEYEYVKSLKEQGQCVCNIKDGGFGGSTKWWTDEMRKKYSEQNVMKSELQRKRMSEHNPMKNRKTALAVADKKKRPVLIGEKEYESVKEAHIALHVATDTIIRWCKKGINADGIPCRYKDAPQNIFVGKRYNKGGCKPLSYLGKHYESTIDLARESNISVYKIYRWLKNGFDPYGRPIRYDSDNRVLSFTRRLGASHPVIVNGVCYSSISEAARNLGISSAWLSDIARGKHKSKKYKCEYDNQQPSQRNTTNSTLEGSETNG